MADLTKALSIEDLRRIAKWRLPRAVFDFFDGGAQDEGTLRGNRAAFERVRLLPPGLVKVSAVGLKTEIFGRNANPPPAIAPTPRLSAGRPPAALPPPA